MDDGSKGNQLVVDVAEQFFPFVELYFVQTGLV
jgi:hypothetical protein